MSDTLSDLEILEYKGKRWTPFLSTHGDFGLLRLYQYFNGNSAAASEFLGFKDRHVVGKKWAALGLSSKGSEAPRSFDGRRTPEQLDKFLLEQSLIPEFAYYYSWELPSSYDEGRIQTFADIHLQSKQCSYARLKQLIEWVKDRSWVRWVLPGDLFNIRTKQSVGTSADENMSLTEAMDLAEYIFKPIAWQCIFIGSGNHDSRILRDADVEWNPVEELAYRLGVKYLGHQGHFIIDIGNKNNRQQYSCYYHHGKGSSGTKGGKVNAALQIMNNTDAELVITAHTHFEFSLKSIRRSTNMITREVDNVTQRLISSPSFLEYAGGYAEEKGLPPEAIGTAGISLSAIEHQIRSIE